MSWTDERINTLKKMWGQGKSASEIAEKLTGVTRNAVIGKAHRLGLSGRPSPIKAVTKKVVAAPVKKPVAAAPAPKAAPAPVAAPAKAKAAAPAPAPKAAAPAAAPAVNKAVAKAQNQNLMGGSRPPEIVVLAALANASSRPDAKLVSILDLNERVCRWPVGDPKEPGFGYCGSEAYPGHPYCAEHVAIAFQAPNRKDGKKPKDIKMAETPELEDLEVEVEDDEEAAEDEALEDDLDDDDTTLAI